MGGAIHPKKSKEKMTTGFEGVEAAKPQKSGNFIRPCDIIARIDRIKKGETRKGIGFIANEMIVLHAFEGSHVVGENITHMLMMDKDSFLGNWKAMIMGIASCAEEEITQEQSEVIISEEQPFSGDVIRVKARNIKTQADKDFTVVDYHGAVLAEEWMALMSDVEKKRCNIAQE